MKTNEVVFILDKSGSMSNLVSDTIGGFNSILKEQSENGEGEVLVSTVLFNERRKVLYDRVKIADVPEMTTKDYKPSGCTALIDAIGYSIKHIKKIYKYIREEDVPDHTLFVIITDGLENSSRDFSSSEVKKMIKEQQDKHNWEFLFIGANIDAIETATHYGIDRDYSFNYLADETGTSKVYDAVSKKVSMTRNAVRNMKSSNFCLCAITADYEKRSKKKK